jgi:hypothetical protein
MCPNNCNLLPDDAVEVEFELHANCMNREGDTYLLSKSQNSSHILCSMKECKKPFSALYFILKSLLIWSQLMELVPISRSQKQHKAGYIHQTQHKPSVGVI